MIGKRSGREFVVGDSIGKAEHLKHDDSQGSRRLARWLRNVHAVRHNIWTRSLLNRKLVLPLLDGELDGKIAQVPAVGGGTLSPPVERLGDRRDASSREYREQADIPEVFFNGWIKMHLRLEGALLQKTYRDA